MSHQQKCKTIDPEVLLNSKFYVVKQYAVTAKNSTLFYLGCIQRYTISIITKDMSYQNTQHIADNPGNKCLLPPTPWADFLLSGARGPVRQAHRSSIQGGRVSGPGRCERGSCGSPRGCGGSQSGC